MGVGGRGGPSSGRSCGRPTAALQRTAVGLRPSDGPGHAAGDGVRRASTCFLAGGRADAAGGPRRGDRRTPGGGGSCQPDWHRAVIGGRVGGAALRTHGAPARQRQPERATVLLPVPRGGPHPRAVPGVALAQGEGVPSAGASDTAGGYLQQPLRARSRSSRHAVCSRSGAGRNQCAARPQRGRDPVSPSR